MAGRVNLAPRTADMADVCAAIKGAKPTRPVCSGWLFDASQRAFTAGLSEAARMRIASVQYLPKVEFAMYPCASDVLTDQRHAFRVPPDLFLGGAN